VTSRQQPSDEDVTAGGPVWTEERIRALGVITDLPTAGRIFGMGRVQAYDLARTGEFPAPVIAVGARFRVPVAGILTALGIPPDGRDLTPSAMASVDHHDAIRCVATPGEQPSEQGET
jgi:hypothetical protein